MSSTRTLPLPRAASMSSANWTMISHPWHSWSRVNPWDPTWTWRPSRKSRSLKAPRSLFLTSSVKGTPNLEVDVETDSSAIVPPPTRGLKRKATRDLDWTPLDARSARILVMRSNSSKLSRFSCTPSLRACSISDRVLAGESNITLPGGHPHRMASIISGRDAASIPCPLAQMNLRRAGRGQLLIANVCRTCLGNAEWSSLHVSLIASMSKN
mmetsp:Transcript_12567/g.31588  ORF Transcript_12567/g.31588 Transcript_12567/m.31588 type:complete len:212 (-) Transcript_12567:125-760(-)